MAGGCSAGCGSCCVVCCNVMNVKLCLKYLISIYGAVRVLGPGVSSYKGYLLWVSGGAAVNLTQVPALLLISLTAEIPCLHTQFFILYSFFKWNTWCLRSLAMSQLMSSYWPRWHTWHRDTRDLTQKIFFSRKNIF